MLHTNYFPENTSKFSLPIFTFGQIYISFCSGKPSYPQVHCTGYLFSLFFRYPSPMETTHWKASLGCANKKDPPVTISKHLLASRVWHVLRRYEKILPMVWTIHHVSVKCDADARLLSLLNFRSYQFGISALLPGFLVLLASAWIKYNTESPSKMLKCWVVWFVWFFLRKKRTWKLTNKMDQNKFSISTAEKHRDEIWVFWKPLKSTWKILVIILVIFYVVVNYFKPEIRLTGKSRRIKSMVT